MKEVFVALGGNIGNRVATFNRALHEIAKLGDITDLRCSCFYQTSPVSTIQQDDYLNAVCTFLTSVAPKELSYELRKIEIMLGKTPKPKEFPRTIDLDILFFGTEGYLDDELEIPHPRWHQRKFVLVPLADLVEEIFVPDSKGIKGKRLVNIKKMIELLPNTNNETIQKVII